MRRLYLHVGLHKTGTTYLQKCLLANRAVFAEAGIGVACYQHAGTGAHFPGFFDALKRDGVDAALARVAASPEADLLLSSEMFCHLMPQPVPDGGGKTWGEVIRDAVMRSDLAVRIVVFVRRQDHLKQSRFFQLVRRYHAGGIDAFERDSEEYGLDARLRYFEAVFGAENVTALLYRDDRAMDVLAALMGAIGRPDLTGEMDRGGGPENPTAHRRKILFLAGVPKANQIAAAFIGRVVLRSSAVHDDGERFLMSPGARADLLALHREGNLALAARHGFDEPEHFLGRPDPDHAWAPPAPIRRAEIDAILGESVREAWRRHDPARAAKMTLGVTRTLLAMRRAGGRPSRE